MNERTFWHFRREVEFQRDLALLAFQELNQCFERIDETFAVRVFARIQALLTAAASISRLLFSNSSGDRARALREFFAVQEGSILKLRGMRNHFEHFDERLDAWLPKTADGSVIDMIASTTRIDEDGPRYQLRMFNITTFEVTFADETLALRPLVHQIRSLGGSTSTHD